MSAQIIERYLAAYEAAEKEKQTAADEAAKKLEQANADLRLGLEQRGAALLQKLLPELWAEIGREAVAHDLKEKQVSFRTAIEHLYFYYSEYFTYQVQVYVYVSCGYVSCGSDSLKIYPDAEAIDAAIGRMIAAAQQQRALIEARLAKDQRELAETHRRVALQEACWPKSVVLGAYKVTYTQMATDDDGERRIDTKYFYSLDEQPGYDGFWVVFKNGEKRRVKILTATTVERIDFSRGDDVAKHFSVPFKVNEDTVWRPVDEILWGNAPELFPGLPKALFDEPEAEVPF